MLDKKCDAIDKFINNHALYFGPCTAEYGAIDVCNNIIDPSSQNSIVDISKYYRNRMGNLHEKRGSRIDRPVFLCRRIQHILYKDTVASGRVIDQNMGV